MQITSTQNNRENAVNDGGDFVLQDFPYTDDYLEPFISARTLRVHYYGHLAKYIGMVNILKAHTPVKNESIEYMIENVRESLYDNATQVYNHYFYFEAINTNGEREPLEMTEECIRETYGSTENFKKMFASVAVGLFGSGWVWLVLRNNNTLGIEVTHNGGTPERALLCLDMWEHAYYLDYENRKVEYIENFLQNIDWRVVENRIKQYL